MKSIEQWAKEYQADDSRVKLGPANSFIAGAAKQKELLTQEIEDLRLDFKRVDNLCSKMNEREKLLMGMIEKLLSSIDVALYNQENNIGCDQCVNNAWVASDLKEELNDVEQTLKQINGK